MVPFLWFRLALTPQARAMGPLVILRFGTLPCSGMLYVDFITGFSPSLGSMWKASMWLHTLENLATRAPTRWLLLLLVARLTPALLLFWTNSGGSD